ncbi:unnamed protein product [Caenorhabditis angaria]|uniref:Uncharacterized protein n=1 Tax=Caenorhabditis angaria TaxID=860376 RepID=A0A9P1J5L5_9PELO|nr:unnamed protein product [Caenorhabditis angaria]
MSRWESFPISEQEQAYLAATTTTTTSDNTAAATVKLAKPSVFIDIIQLTQLYRTYANLDVVDMDVVRFRILLQNPHPSAGLWHFL